MILLDLLTEKFYQLKGKTKDYIEENFEVEQLLNLNDEPDIFTDEEI